MNLLKKRLLIGTGIFVNIVTPALANNITSETSAPQQLTEDNQETKATEKYQLIEATVSRMMERRDRRDICDKGTGKCKRMS